jgi:hypothetical protein
MYKKSDLPIDEVVADDNSENALGDDYQRAAKRGGKASGVSHRLHLAVRFVEKLL